MKKLDIPCGEGNVAIIFDQTEMKIIGGLLRSDAAIKGSLSFCAGLRSQEFDEAAGLSERKSKPEKVDDPFFEF